MQKKNIFQSRKGAYCIMVIPALVWMVLINIVPMFGIIMAFQDFNPGKGIFRSKFIGLENFEYMFQLKDVSQIFTNTIVIAVGKLLLNVLVPVIFALLLNEIKNVAFKRCIQTVVICLISSPGLSWAVSFWMYSGFTVRSIWYSRLSEWSPSLFSESQSFSGPWPSVPMSGKNLALTPWSIWRPSPASALPYMRRQPLMGQGAGAGCGTSRCRDSSR